MTAPKTIDQYFEQKAAVWSPTTLQAELGRVSTLKRLGFPDKDLHHILAEAFALYHPYTVKQLFIRARAIDDEVYQQKYGVREFMKANATAFRGVYVGRAAIPTPQQIEEILKIAAGIDPDIFNYLYLMAWGGLRKSEALALEWEDIDDYKGWMVVRQGKGRRDRIVPFPQTMQQRLILNDHPKVCGGIKEPIRVIRRIRKVLGLVFTPHSLRSAALTMYSEVLTPHELRDFAGHSDFNTTLKYLIVDKKRVADKINTLTGGPDETVKRKP